MNNDAIQSIFNEIDGKIDEIQFLSPNEPITPYGIRRLTDKISEISTLFDDAVSCALGGMNDRITIWDQNMAYHKHDMVIFFKKETHQLSPESGIREFVFILSSLVDGNTNIPSYDMVDGIPDFTKSKWNLLNPMSYLLQDMIQLKEVVKTVFKDLMAKHV